MTRLPAREAVAYTSVFSTLGTRWAIRSRSTPPPTAVRSPSIMGYTKVWGLPWDRPVRVPVTVKEASPTVSAAI